MRVIHVVFTYCYIIGISSIQLFGQTQTRITLKDAIDIGLKNSKNSKITNINFEKSSQTIRKQLSPLFPQLSAFGSFSYNVLTPTQYLPISVEENTGYLKFTSTRNPINFSFPANLSSKVSASQLLFNWGLFFAVPITNIQNMLAIKNKDAENSDYIFSVVSKYYGAILAQLQTNLAKQSIHRTRKGLEDAKRIFNQGIIPDIDTLRASIVYLNTLSLLTQVGNSASIALTALKTEIGFNESDDIVLLDSLLYAPDTYINSLSFDDAYKIALRERPEIILLELQNKLYALNKQAAMSDLLPTLSAFAEFQANPVFITDKSLSLATTFVTGIQLSVPIFDGFKSVSNIELARLDAEKLSLQLELAKERLRTEVYNQISKIREITERIGAKKQTLESSKRLYTITKSRWEKGLSSQLELSDAELSLTESQLGFSQVVYEYLIQRATFNKILGRMNVE